MKKTCQSISAGLVCAAAFGFVVAAAPAFAQDSYAPAYSYGSYGPPEEVYVYPPRSAPERGFSGANVGTVSISRPIRYDDLDLRTDWGAAALRHRIFVASERMCRKLNQLYPTTVYPLQTDSYDCQREATADAMEQADDAIARARSYAD